MLRVARTTVLALALCAGGCWTNVCIEKSAGGGGTGRCSEEVDSAFNVLLDDVQIGDATYDYEGCDIYEIGTTCEDEGYAYDCGDGYWYWDADACEE